MSRLRQWTRSLPCLHFAFASPQNCVCSVHLAPFRTLPLTCASPFLREVKCALRISRGGWVSAGILMNRGVPLSHFTAPFVYRLVWLVLTAASLSTLTFSLTATAVGFVRAPRRLPHQCWIRTVVEGFLTPQGIVSAVCLTSGTQCPSPRSGPSIDVVERPPNHTVMPEGGSFDGTCWALPWKSRVQRQGRARLLGTFSSNPGMDAVGHLIGVPFPIRSST